MKLWLIEAEVPHEDVYESAVVAAETEEDARRTHPAGEESDFGDADGTWPIDEKLISVRLIGEAREGTPPHVILASFIRG